MARTADSNGHLIDSFTIPPNVRAGVKSVRVIGDQGSLGEAIFIGQGARITQFTRRVITHFYDPLAQTFTLTQAAMVRGVDLWFTAKGTSAVTVQLRTTANGVPDAVIVAEARMTPAQIQTTGSTRITWTPVRLEADREYALVVACDDAIAALALAQLGRYDSANQRWVTAQPYQVGVLLSSSNNRTWTAHQDRDLTFQLLAANFTAASRRIALPDVTVTAGDVLMVLARIDRPTAETDVRFELTLPDGVTILTASPMQPITLAAPVTGTLQWAALLTGSAAFSPILAQDLQLIWGTRSATGTYISRAMTAAANCTVTLYLDAHLPSGSGITVELQSGVDGNDDPTWTPVSGWGSPTPLGDNWFTRRYRLTSFSPTDDQTRVKLTLTGSSQAYPRVRNLRVVVT